MDPYSESSRRSMLGSPRSNPSLTSSMAPTRSGGRSASGYDMSVPRETSPVSRSSVSSTVSPRALASFSTVPAEHLSSSVLPVHMSDRVAHGIPLTLDSLYRVIPLSSMTSLSVAPPMDRYRRTDISAHRHGPNPNLH